ncbi:glycosyltransferase [Winogradskyella sp.]|uniref:glycosyltransferase n=1 Tax=Winogradskyella sp. TaxID=1883156 RepID=UPI003AB58191
MKILLISMPSIHVIRWVENLKQTEHDIYWFDVMGRGTLETNVINEEKQFVGWKNRKVKYIKGEFLLSRIYPELYVKLLPLLEVTAAEKLENIINTIKPDVIHSFEMQSCCYPILKTMNKFPKLKWIYSCWGSDLFYYSNFKSHKNKIKKVLSRVDYLFTDCIRDYYLARDLDFKGIFLGALPGGAGYDLKKLKPFKTTNRKVILVKGYEHTFGKALKVIKALELLPEIINYKVVIFGAHQEVIDYITCRNLEFKTYTRHGLSHDALLELMGQALIYIGNSISDGVPNTMLEAIVMGAFPIQSNPGGATEEYIINNENGLIINDPENIDELKKLILSAINSTELREKAKSINGVIARGKLTKKKVQKQIIDSYLKI